MSLQAAIQRKRDQDLESWVVFTDLIKAFDAANDADGDGVLDLTSGILLRNLVLGKKDPAGAQKKQKSIVEIANGDGRLSQFLGEQGNVTARSATHPTHGYATTPVHRLFNEHTWYRYQGEDGDKTLDLATPFADTQFVTHALNSVHSKDPKALMCEDQ